MEEPNEGHRVVPELYFLIAKFLSGGPLKETAKTLLKELETIEVLPRRTDWEGTEHTQSYDELASQYSDVSFNRLAAVCERALQLARRGSAAGDNNAQQGLAARLSLLSESLVRPMPQYASHKLDHSLVRRLVARELGAGAAALPGGRGGQATFPPRMLASLNLQRRTLGHLSAVYCVVFDCTGRYVITGADDMLVKVWSALDGRLVATLRGVGAEVTDVCVSADGALVACGSVDKLVRVWCLRSAEPRAVLSAHAGTITSVHWAPPARRDVRWLASTSTDCSVAFWTCSPDGYFLSQPVQYVERMRPGVCHMICAAWSAGGAFLAAGSADHHVRIYTVEHEPGGPKRVLETAVHDDAVDSIAWAHRGLRFVSGSKDGTAALWTLHATQWRHHLLQPTSTNSDGKKLKMTMVCWDCSDAYVITAVSDNTIRVWCSRTCTQVRSLGGHRDEAYVLEAHPFLSGVFLSAGHDGQLFVWDAQHDQPLARFHNRIDGHGDGAIFDAKWGGGASVAATDSHGHLLLLGIGRGHRLYSHLPTELFFHTDYRPVIVDSAGGAHDEQTDTPPHLLPPPFLVDVEGAPHAPEYQRLVPGRENLALSQLIPVADAPRSQINSLIEALAAGMGGAGGRGVWRGEGVRYTAGSWQRGDPLLVPQCTRPIVPRLAPPHRDTLHRAAAELNALEQAWYRREMRRRPLMISTAPDGGPRRRAARRPAARPATRPQPRPEPPEPLEPDSLSGSDTSDEWLQRPSAARTARPSHTSRTSRTSNDTRASLSSLELDDTTSSSSSSQYSDWEAGAALAPPARARRRPLRPTNRYSPSQVPAKRAPAPAPAPPPPAHIPVDPGPAGSRVSGPLQELPDAYRPGEWITAVSPRKAPYHPQMGDQCLYFRLGHQRYFEAVAEKDVYKINPRDKPWERSHVYECELVKVVGIKYVIKPPRVVCLRLACSLPGEGAEGGSSSSRSITVRYHDMPDVIDFLVLRQQYDAAVARRWGAGDRFRCMIDDCWWTGEVLERAGDPGAGASDMAGGPHAHEWASAAAAHFLALKVRWDNGEVERLSPWDLEPLDPSRLPAQAGGAVPVLPVELDAVLYRATTDEWGGDRPTASRAIAEHIGSVMSLAAAEPFVAPVDLQQYPAYARVVPYPVDLATIRARCSHLFYRRAAAAQFDARYLASNAERFNEPHAPIVRQARLVTDLLLHIIAEWRDCDVLAKYHELADNYRSSDDEPLLHTKSRGRGGRSARESEAWRAACTGVLSELMGSADAEPFRAPVSPDQAPDYLSVVSRPMDLGRVAGRLTRGEYSAPEQFVADVRQVFANSRLYNTNKRSRIYSMTVRLSALFEALWSRLGAGAGAGAGARGAGQGTRAPAPPRRHNPPHPRHRPRPALVCRPPRPARAARPPALRAPLDESMNGSSRLGSSGSSSSDSETLAATSRRVHAARASTDSDAPLTVHSKGTGGGGTVARLGSSSSDSETLAATSRRVHAARASTDSDAPLTVHSKDSDAPLTVHSKGTGGGGTVARLGSSSSDSETLAATSRRVHAARASTDSDAPLTVHSKARLGSSSSDSETLAATSRRVHAARASTDSDAPLTVHSKGTGGGGPVARLGSSSSDSETLAATSRRVHAARASTDSDAPLTVHSKGKGIGKKSKSSSASASAEPVASTSRDTRHESYSEVNGKRAAGSWEESSSSSSSSSSCTNIEVLEEQLHDEVELTYTDSDQNQPRGLGRSGRKRRPRPPSSASSAGLTRRHAHKPKRTRERFTAGSTSSSLSSEGSGGSGSGRRYESDRSYRPRYSTDDDRPLHLYRQRRADPPSNSSNSGGVSLRARRSQRRYNEDSEEDSVAAISKRMQHHSRAHHAHLATRRRHHAAQSAGAHRSDHNYFNGLAAPDPLHNANGTRPVAGAAGASGAGGAGSAGGPGGAGSAAVSVSSRGRVRKLTPKARGLLRD
ncbi:unnamed protein product [Arctia plantaginis]|uniref:Bromo domain-containing protein n=1 Tax=Arctia plantaginis TaxID=874455 RepID=A0A8S1ADI0_ARCPL|nr:unnamed protein product [Arctia plantaginis]